MRESEQIARQRYMRDPVFHNLVRTIEKFMHETNMSPNEIHAAVNLSADMVNKARRTDMMYTEMRPHK